MTRDVKVTFCMTYFSSIKIILHLFNVDNNGGLLGIGYDMIIDRDLMVQICLMDNFQFQFMKLDFVGTPIKDPIIMLGQAYLTSYNIIKVEIKNAEPVFTI